MNISLIIISISLFNAACVQAASKLSLLRQAIEERSKESWAYSGASGGGYVFRVKLDVVGDDKEESLMNYSIDDRNDFHIFSSDSQTKYLGSISWGVLDKPKKKENEKTIIWSTRDIGNYPIGKYEAFSKLVIKNEITAEGVTEDIRLAGVGPGRIEDREYNQILYEGKSMEGVGFFDLKIEYKDLKSFLLKEGSWQIFDKTEWVSPIGGFYIKKSDMATSSNNKSSSYTFTPEQALKILSIENEKNRRKDEGLGVRSQKNRENAFRDVKSKKSPQASSQWIYALLVAVATGIGIWYLRRKSA